MNAPAISTQMRPMLIIVFCLILTHFRRKELATIIKWTCTLPFKGHWVVFFIFIHILKEHSVSKQWRP